jgi:RNA-directed DNA polymerase
MGLRLSPEKTAITHQRRRKRGSHQHYVYNYPSKQAIANITGKVKTLCRQATNQDLADMLLRLNRALIGWCAYFRPGVSSKAFQYLRAFVWKHVWAWLRRKHRKSSWKDLRRRYCDGGWWPHDGDVTLFDTGTVRTTTYRYRGADIPKPWPPAS